MTLVRNTINLPGGDPVQGRVKVEVQLVAGGFHGDATEILGVKRADIDSTGQWELDLVPNDIISPAGTFYQAVERVGSESQTHPFAVPAPVAFTGGSRTSNVVTLTGLPLDHKLEAGDSITVDAFDNTYDGTFTVTSAGSTTVTYPQTAADDASSGSGTITKTLWDLFDLLVDDSYAANPAFALEEVATKAEVVELVGRGAAGFIRSLNPKAASALFVSNSTTETSMLDAVRSMPRVIPEAVVRVVAWGVCRCTAGGPVNMTARLRNTTDALVLASAVVQLTTDTDANRPWRFEVVAEGNFVIGNACLSGAQLLVGAGATDTLKQALGQAANAEGSDPQNWDLSLQFSVANSGIGAVVYGAQVTYALAGE